MDHAHETIIVALSIFFTESISISNGSRLTFSITTDNHNGR